MKWYEDPVYIKMSDCPEIQNSHIENEGNLYVSRNYCVVSALRIPWDDRHRDRFIWLPRQEDLQAMVGIAHYSHIIPLFYEFNKTCYGGGMKWPNGIFTSMEQLWLAYVKKENHNKTWDGDKWIPC